MGTIKQAPTRRRFLGHCLGVSGLLMGGGWVSASQAGRTALLRRVRTYQKDGHVRVVLDLDVPTSHTLFALHDPERVVVDLKNTRAAERLTTAGLTGGMLRRLRWARKADGTLRVVFDLSERVRSKSFPLAADAKHGPRVVVDLERHTQPAAQPVKQVTPRRGRDVIIAIDAGHGGKDPGAVGPRGTREKDVVLAIARRLEALVRKTPGMRPVMIRRGDQYVPLRERINRARRHKADLFISIHADAARDRKARGSSVYVLSQRGATSEHARWLARRENDADLIGGLSLGDVDPTVAPVLLDLSLTAKIEESFELGEAVLDRLKRTGRVHSRRVEQAGFVVLKAPDIPAILVETAFISNPQEEHRLRTRAFQHKVAEAILGGVKAYLKSNPPQGTLMMAAGSGEHVIRRGETLTQIANRYGTDVRTLRELNALEGDVIRPGQVLRVPRGS